MLKYSKITVCRTTKIIFYVCLLTHFARQDRQNGNLKNQQNHATELTKIKNKTKLQKLHEPNNSLLTQNSRVLK